jgi:hypothetical protein
MSKIPIRRTYSTAKGHGFSACIDGQSFPWARTVIGARRIANSWINSGLNADQIESAIGCGWSVEFAKKVANTPEQKELTGGES